MVELDAVVKNANDAGQPMSQFDYVTDVVVVGSGSGGLTAALAARDSGKDVLLLESTDLVGGCSSKSGGGLWIPNNSLMKEAGVKDTYEAARAYMDDVIGDVGPASSTERRDAFLIEGPKMVHFLRNLGFKFKYARDYCDYYPHNIGGSVEGREIQGEFFNLRKLGKQWSNKLREVMPMAMYNEEVKNVCTPMSFRGMRTLFKVVFIRLIGGNLLGKRLVGLGGALIGQLLKLVIDKNIQVWLNSPLLELIEKDGSVIGVVIQKDNKKMRIRVNQGVILAAGGFAKNLEMRQKYHPHPITTEWTSAAVGDNGDAIRAGMVIGAETALMDDAWWGPSFVSEKGAGFMLWERSNPYCFIVDSKGNRFMNESASYVDCGHWQYEANLKAPAIPAYMIFDSRHRKNYMFGHLMPGSTPQSALQSGFVVKADTLEELAKACDIDSHGLVRTAKRFAGFAKTGKDLDFKRGDSAYDRVYSDPRVKPNPNLAAVEKPPFYAVKVYPGDLSTKGGLLTDKYARVLHKNGSIIKGLYAVGNSSASVMGRTYPGPGATIGPAMTFGYIAGRHAATISD